MNFLALTYGLGGEGRVWYNKVMVHDCGEPKLVMDQSLLGASAN